MKEIRQKKWYRPREIARLGLIKNSVGGTNLDTRYNFILLQIKNGNLAAKNYGGNANHPYYLVSEDAIRDYHKGENRAQ